MSGIYIHIPFCKQACSYCDFYFVTRQQHKQDFVDQLIHEIKSKAGTAFTEEPVKSVYFGGGTPSLLSISQVESIISALGNSFDLQTDEVTLEMNPDDVSADYLAGLHDVGVTRASMGVQSFDEGLLKTMNRAHTKDEALKCMEALSASPIEKFTVDLIYGNPGQSEQLLHDDLELLLSFNPPHVSAYSLTIEPRTRLGKQLELGRIAEVEDDIIATHFDIVKERLEGAGVMQYEVSNYAQPGSEAIHNSAYWTHTNYLGLGPGAHSFWWKDDSHAWRWQNKSDLKAYLGSTEFNPFEKEELNVHALVEERIMLGLRTRNGISLDKLKRRYQFTFNDRAMSYINQKVDEGKMAFDGKVIKLTAEGLKISDALVLDLITLHPV
jgi:oxygen-independent coproporphyrinogen-3 oxidase